MFLAWRVLWARNNSRRRRKYWLSSILSLGGFIDFGAKETKEGGPIKSKIEKQKKSYGPKAVVIFDEWSDNSSIKALSSYFFNIKF